MSHVAIFALNYAPEPTGNAPYTTAYAEALAAAGHKVTVVSGYPHYPAWTARYRRWRWSTEQHDGIRLIRVPHAVPASPDAAGRLRLEASYGVASLLPMAQLGQFDAAVGVVPSLSGGLAARVAGLLRRRPVGLLVQDLISAATAQGGVPGAGARLAGAVASAERRVIRGTHVGAVARGFEAPLEVMGAASITYLPNFMTLPVGAHRSVAETRARFGIPQAAFVVGYSGNLGYKQDFPMVIAAANQLRNERSVCFVIVGDGSQRALIDGAIADGRINALRLPLQPAQEVVDLLRACDLLLAPQRSTDVDMSIPSKLTAYLFAGRPVLGVASAGSETAVQIQRSGGGMVIDPGDPRTLATAILALRSEPAKLEMMGVAGQRYARREFAREPALSRFVSWTEGLR